MSESRSWWVLAVLAALGVLLYLLAPVLTPFMVAALLAYMGDPLVDRLEAWRVPRTLAVAIVFLVLTTVAVLALLVLVPMLQRQVVVLVQKLPGYLEWLQHTALPWFSATLGVPGINLDLELLRNALQGHWIEAGGVVRRVVGAVTQSGLALALWLANLVLIPVVTFYLLRDWDLLVERVRALIPRRLEPEVVQLARESDQVLAAFLRGQLLVMSALAVIYATGLQLVGLDLALLIGLLAGVVSFVPYLGFIVGIVVAGTAALMQFHDPVYLGYVAAVFAVGQAVEGWLLTPWLVGDRIGLHPVAVIFAVLAGGQLFGFFGVLLALPVAAVVMVLLRYAHQRYRDSGLYAAESNEP
ncbi:MAG: AI-2E family transporter [Pseudomonadota bacterium]|nr:MAG: AI-2E family transporter [Pseudomonadota bacterium]